MNTTRHVRNGLGAVRPYVYGPPGLLGFVQETFAAEVVEHSPDGGEVEVRIGDSAIAHLDWDELTDLIEDSHAMIARRS